jgi:flavin-dependent dehydrogenase
MFVSFKIGKLYLLSNILKETNISRWFAPNQDMFEFKSDINDIWFKRGGTNSFENKILKKSNVNIILNTDVIDISSRNVKVRNIVTKEKKIYEPRIIVISSGNHQPYFSKDKDDNIIQSIYAHGFVVDCLDIEPDIPHIFFDCKLFHNSYLYMVQNSDENTGYIAYGRLLKDSLTVDELKKNKIINKALSKSKFKQNISGRLYTGNQSTLTEKNKLFIGDAANLMDPFLNYGVTNSIKSGIFAAESIAHGTNIMESYKTMVKKEISSELQKQMQMRRLFNKLNDKDINSIIRLLNGLNDNGKIEELFYNLPKLMELLFQLI